MRDLAVRDVGDGNSDETCPERPRRLEAAFAATSERFFGSLAGTRQSRDGRARTTKVGGDPFHLGRWWPRGGAQATESSSSRRRRLARQRARPWNETFGPMAGSPPYQRSVLRSGVTCEPYASMQASGWTPGHE